MHIEHPICGIATVLPKRPDTPVKADTRWAVLVDLVKCCKSFGLNDRDLAVLRGLISCLPKADASKSFVFASNATLSDRTDGMNERTLRRHLAKLVTAGLITRHNSPNGKRYVRRNHLGQASHAFGFDLAPLFDRRAEIAAAAVEIRKTADTVAKLREDLSLLRHNLLSIDADLAETIRKALRRDITELTLETMILSARTVLAAHNRPVLPSGMSANDSQIVRHKQKSIKELIETERCEEKTNGPHQVGLTETLPSINLPRLASVLAACPESCDLAYEPLANWPDLIRFATVLAPMLQIDRVLLDAAKTAMGAVGAAVTVMCIVQMGKKIHSAGAYFRGLTKRASLGQFSPAALVKSLLAAQNKVGAGG